MGTAHVRFSAEDRRAQIIETATALFARQGFEGTTTRQIAERAGVNEAIIFRHFPSKEDLYWAVIENQCAISKVRDQVESLLANTGEVRDVFVNLAEDFLRRREENDTLPRLLFFTALENHQLSYRFFQEHIVSFYETLADYIRERIKEGRFREVDPVMAARSFFGSLVYHYMVQDLFGAKRTHAIDRHKAAETLVDLWMNGMISQAPERPAEGKPRARKNLSAPRQSEK